MKINKGWKFKVFRLNLEHFNDRDNTIIFGKAFHINKTVNKVVRSEILSYFQQFPLRCGAILGWKKYQ